MKKTIMTLTIVVLCLVLIVGIMPAQAAENNRKVLFELPDNFWKVYISIQETPPKDEYAGATALQENGKDYVNYWMSAREAIGIVYRAEKYGTEKDIDKAEEILDNLMATWNEYGFFPRQPYSSLKYGWVSSMDAPSIMLASEMLYEHTNEQKYRDFGLSMLPYVYETVDRNGINLKLSNGGVWPLEYAYADATEKDAMFVLNGSVLAYVSLKALSDIYNDESLNEYLKSVEQAYAGKFAEFRKGDSWSYYMLHEKAVIPIHYIVFEKKLFEACYMLTGNELFGAELDYRTECLKNVLKLQFYQEEEGTAYYQIRACSPNPYQIDTHTTTIEFLNEEGEVVVSRIVVGSGKMADKKAEFHEAALVQGVFPNDPPASYRVYTETGMDKYLLFEDKVIIEEGEKKNEAEYAISIERDSCYLDGTNERIVVFDPDKHEKGEGDIVYTLDMPREANVNDYYVLEVGNLSQSNIPIGLIVYDSNSLGVVRNYTNLVPGMNAVAFTLDGFVNSEDLSDVAKIWLRIYDQSIDPDETMIYVDGMRVFNDNREYMNYINQYRYLISPQ